MASARTRADGPIDAGRTRLLLVAEISPIDVFSRYLIHHLFLGFAAVAGLLLLSFTTLDPINGLDDVNPGGYRWAQAVLVVLMTLPRILVEPPPFIVLLGGIVGLGQLLKNNEPAAIRNMGFSTFRIALVVLAAGILWTVSLGAIDEWVASSLQQQALQIKSTTAVLGGNNNIIGNMPWVRCGNEFVAVKLLNEQGQPMGVEISHYRDNFSPESYIYARSATIRDDKVWILHGVNHKRWLNGKETLETSDNLTWQSIFTSMNLKELSMLGNTSSVRQLNHYIHYLQEIGQPNGEYRLTLWEKPGQSILTLTMVLPVVPFVFSAPRSPGMGNRLAAGVIVGLLAWISYQIVVNLGLLFALSASVTTPGLPVAFVLVALSLVYRHNR